MILAKSDRILYYLALAVWVSASGELRAENLVSRTICMEADEIRVDDKIVMDYDLAQRNDKLLDLYLFCKTNRSSLPTPLRSMLGSNLTVVSHKIRARSGVVDLDVKSKVNLGDRSGPIGIP